MKELEVIIKNKLGLHTRAAAMLVENISKYSSDVTIVKDGQEVDGKSIMGIMTLAASIGTRLLIRADGSDENNVLNMIEDLVEGKFGEE